jgi:hypothetical protein
MIESVGDPSETTYSVQRILDPATEEAFELPGLKTIELESGAACTRRDKIKEMIMAKSLASSLKVVERIEKA